MTVEHVDNNFADDSHSSITDTLERNFKTPPASARPGVFWQWSGGMISRDGLTKDLEAMASQGIGGVMVMQMPEQFAHKQRWDFRNYKGKVNVLSDEWFALVNHAIGEADRLGLTFSIFICPGWSHAGGPWITREKGLKVLISGKHDIAGPLHFKGSIARGDQSIGWHHESPPWLAGEDPSQVLQQEPDFYRDVAVVAVPALDSGDVIPAENIIDLTGKMDNKGMLDWNVPAGKWVVHRFGIASENGINHPAPFEATGLEGDRMDPESVRLVFENMTGRIIREAREKGYRSFKAFETDSYEAGFQDFGLDFREQFKKRRGYDCVPWLSAWLNKKLVISSRQLTDRFRNDMMQTISELTDERFHSQLRKLADDNNVQWMIEPYFKLHIDWRTSGARSEYPGAEFWVGKSFDYVGPGPDIAALYGLPVVWAEAFTAESYQSAWRNDPQEMKPWGDVAYCRGLNHFYLHGFVHNPFGDHLQPGFTMSSWGTQLGRHVTWWQFSGAWHRYLARCQFMLQQGRPVNDILVYPQKRQHVATVAVDAGPFRQVVVNDEALLERLSVREDGRIEVKGGGDFSALVLTPGVPLRPQYLRKIRDFVREGATLIGVRPPLFSASLQNYPQSDTDIKQLADEMWNQQGAGAFHEYAFGKGKILASSDFEGALHHITAGPDVLFSNASPEAAKTMDFAHRREGNTDIYFVCNTSNQSFNATVNFRVSGRQPELWNPVTGEIKEVNGWFQKEGRTVVAIDFDPQQSFFVIFRSKTDADSAGSMKKSSGENKILSEINGPWDVSFDKRWGGPGKVVFQDLSDWSKHPKEGIKYYSGVATYLKSFDFQKPESPGVVFLELGEVHDLARVTLNGRDLGVIWCAPWKIAVPRGLLKKTGNKLKVEVVNNWVNRLIGDEQHPEDYEVVEWNPNTNRKGSYDLNVGSKALRDLPDWVIDSKERPSKNRYTFSTWIFYNKDAPLQSAGLLGPVKLVISQNSHH